MKRKQVSFWLDPELKDRFAVFCKRRGLQLGRELEQFMRHLMESSGDVETTSAGMILISPPPLAWLGQPEHSRAKTENTLKTYRWRCPKCNTVQYPNQVPGHPRNMTTYEETGHGPLCEDCQKYAGHLWPAPEMELIQV